MQMPPTPTSHALKLKSLRSGLCVATCLALALMGCSPGPSASPPDGTATPVDVAEGQDTNPSPQDVADGASSIEDGKPSNPAADGRAADGQSTTVISRRDTVGGDAGAPPSDVSQPTDTAADATLAAECAANDDCVLCAFPTAPTTPDDCYCVYCPTTIMTAAECTANQEAWDTQCASELWPPRDTCPQPRCILGQAPICFDGQCTDTCVNAICPALGCPAGDQELPFGECCPVCTGETACGRAADCIFCADLDLTESVNDCACRGCETEAISRQVCTARADGHAAYCEPWPSTLEPCSETPCLAEPAPIVCDRFAQCQRNPNRCFGRLDCTACGVAAIPTHSGECRCPSCPVPTSTAFCEAATTAHTTLCADFDTSQCPQLNCLARELRCPFGGGVCAFGPGTIIDRR